MTETVPPAADPAIQAQRALLDSLLTAAIRAAHPDLALPPHLPEPSPGRLIILAAGKAAGSMSAVASRFYRQQHGLGDDRIVGLAVARHGYGQEAPGIHMVEAGHPVPDEAGIAATKEALRLATEAGPDDEVLVLLSGGGSANWIAPAGDLTLTEKQAITRAMLRSGAPIGEINTVRKHISRIKGGRLALAARNARRILTLAISDVPFDDPAVIASGPTVPDPSTLAEAKAICERRHIPLPEAATRLLNDPNNETPKAGDPAFARAEYRIIARPIDALNAAAEGARAAGYEPVMLGADLEGEAREVAAEHAVAAKRYRQAGQRVALIPGDPDPLLAHESIRRIVLGLPDIWSLGGARAAAAGIWHAEAARRLAAALAALPVPPDCIHLHQWTRTLSPAVFPVLSGAGVPLIVTLHDYALACPNGVYYRFDRAEPCGLVPLSAACIAAPCDARSRAHKLVRVARTMALRQAVRGRPLHVVHVCDASRRRMGDLLGDYAVTHHRIDNPVRIAEGPAAEPAGGDAIAYVGRLTREKGADLVADAARAAGLPALFIGAGPLEANLRARDGVEIIGWQSPAAVWEILRRRARALAAPSRWYETGPLTVYEALAAGIPVVASDRSGAAEKVRHGQTGFVVAPEVGPLAAAFTALRDDACTRTLGARARVDAEDAPMTLATHAAALRTLYGGLTHPSAAVQHRPLPASLERS